MGHTTASHEFSHHDDDADDTDSCSNARELQRTMKKRSASGYDDDDDVEYEHSVKANVE